MGEAATEEAFRLTTQLRREGYAVQCDLMGRSVKAQMKYANKIGALYSMVLGDSELEAGSAQLKQMATGTAKPVSLLHFLPEFETEMQNGWCLRRGLSLGLFLGTASDSLVWSLCCAKK